MDLDWNEKVIPGKSMFNLELGTSYMDVLKFIKDCEISEGIFKIKNSDPMRLVIDSNKEIIVFKKMKDENYAWQSDLAMLHFKNGFLNSITTYLNEPHSYRGLICEVVGLGDEIRPLENHLHLQYDDINEVIYSMDGDKDIGFEMYGTSSDLVLDPHQKLGGIRVFTVD